MASERESVHLPLELAFNGYSSVQTRDQQPVPRCAMLSFEYQPLVPYRGI
jgi:hypothetical protein